jgi:hypothetical protein
VVDAGPLVPLWTLISVERHPELLGFAPTLQILSLQLTTGSIKKRDFKLLGPPYKDVRRVPLWTLVSVQRHLELLGSRAYPTQMLNPFNTIESDFV